MALANATTPKSNEDPAVGAVLLFTGAQVYVGEGRHKHQCQGGYCQRDQCRMAEELCPSAEQDHCQPELHYASDKAGR